MRNKNNIEENQSSNEIAADIELAVMVFLLAALSFAAGFYTAASQIERMLAAQ